MFIGRTPPSAASACLTSCCRKSGGHFPSISLAIPSTTASLVAPWQMPVFSLGWMRTILNHQHIAIIQEISSSRVQYAGDEADLLADAGVAVQAEHLRDVELRQSSQHLCEIDARVRVWCVCACGEASA